MTQEDNKPGKSGVGGPGRPRGRPKGAKNKPRISIGEADLSRRELAKVKTAALAAARTRRAWEQAAAIRAQVEREVGPDHACLRYLDKTNRLAWLCLQIHKAHVEEKVVNMGPGMGYELVDVATDAPRFRAMELLMKACGDFPRDGGAVVNATVIGAGESVNNDGQAQIVLMVADNGRGPDLEVRRGELTAPEEVE